PLEGPQKQGEQRGEGGWRRALGRVYGPWRGLCAQRQQRKDAHERRGGSPGEPSRTPPVHGTVPRMGIVVAVLGLVAVLQGTAWLGGARSGRRRRTQGTVLAPVGAAMLVLGVLHALVPGFWHTDAPRAELTAKPEP